MNDTIDKNRLGNANNFLPPTGGKGAPPGHKFDTDMPFPSNGVLGVISDLHIEFRTPKEVAYLVSLINQSPAHAIIHAGDLHPDPEYRDRFRDLIKKPWLHVNGNHDYWGSVLSSDLWVGPCGQNHLLASASLWTDFRGDALSAELCTRAIGDFRRIQLRDGRFIDLDAMVFEHDASLKLIGEASAQIVVTHFAPFLGSVHPRFVNDFATCYFVNDLARWYQMTYAKKKAPQLWIHGHVHDPFDYYFGDTRVVCNPLGYPHERAVNKYEVKLVELV